MYYSPIFILVQLYTACCNESNQEDDLAVSESDKPIYRYIPASNLAQPSYGFQAINQEHSYPSGDVQYGIDRKQYAAPPHQDLDQGLHSLQSMLASNPLLAALFLSSTLGISSGGHTGFNHPQHPPINPYVSLLLSNYGRYLNIPFSNMRRGIYAYTAANNYHNNKPFGAYKVYEDP